MQTQHFENGTHWAACDDTRTSHCRTHHNAASAVAPFHVVVQGARVFQRHTDQLTLGLFSGLADRLGYFFGFTLAKADAALLIANNHKRGKAKAFTPLYGFGHAVDRDQAVCELWRCFFAVIAAVIATTAFATVFTFCHVSTPQNFSPPSRAASAKALILP